MADNDYELSGPISSIKYRNSDGWAVFMMPNGVECTGVLAEMIDVGSDVTCVGTYICKHGFPRQLKCVKVIPAPIKVNSAEGVAKLLQRLPGIGQKRALMAIQEYGYQKAWELAKTSPEAIGVYPHNVNIAMQIANSLVDNIDATIYLLSIGLTDNKVNRVLKHFGANQAKEVVSENPYRLMEVEGFGFLTADDVAFKAGMTAGNRARVSACVMHCLNNSQKNEGHIYHFGKRLIAIVLDTLVESAKKAHVPMMDMPGYEEVREVIYGLASEGKVVIDEGKVFSKELLDCEKVIEEVLGE